MDQLRLARAVRGKVRRTKIADTAAARPADLGSRRVLTDANRLWLPI